MPIKFYWTNLSDHNDNDEGIEKCNHLGEETTEKVVQIEQDEDGDLICAQINPKKLHEKFQEYVKDKNGLFTSSGLEDFTPDLSACSSSSSIGNDSITSGDERSSSLVRKNKALKAEKEQLYSRIEALNEQISSLEHDQENLQNRNMQMEQHLRSRQNLEEDHEKLLEELYKTTQENDDWKSLNTKLHNEIASLKKSRNDDNENIAQLNNQVLTLVSEKELLSAGKRCLCQEIQDLRDQLVRMEEDINAKDHQINKATEQYRKERALTDQYQKQNEQFRQRNEQLNSELQDMQYELSFKFSGEATTKPEPRKPDIKDLFSEIKEAEEQMNESNSGPWKLFDCEQQADASSQTMPVSGWESSDVGFDETKEDSCEEIRSLKEIIETLQNELADGEEKSRQMINQNGKSVENIALLSDVNSKMLQGKLLEWYDDYKTAFDSDDDDKILPSIDDSEICISSRLDALNLNIPSSLLSTSKKSTWLSRTLDDKVFQRTIMREILTSFGEDVETCEARSLVATKCRQIVFYHISKKIEERYVDGSSADDNQNNAELLWKLIDYLDKYSVIVGSLSCERKTLPLIKVLLGHINKLFAETCSLRGSIETLKLKPNIVPDQNSIENFFSKSSSSYYEFSPEFLENAKSSPFNQQSPENLLPNALSNVYSYSCSAMIVMRKLFFLSLLFIAFGLLTVEMPEYSMNPPVY